MKNQPKGYDCKHYYSGSTALQSENCFQLLPNCWDDLGGLFFLSPTWKLYHYFLGLKSQQLKATRTIFKSCSPSGELFILLSPTQEPIGPLVGELTKAVRSGNHIYWTISTREYLLRLSQSCYFFTLWSIYDSMEELFGKKGGFFNSCSSRCILRLRF